MLQGGEVCHLAARAKGVKERISTITSYRSTLPKVYDSSYITNVRPYADTTSLYTEWTRYRLRKLRDELTYYLEKTEKEDDPAQEIKNVQALIDQQIDYQRRTSRQMVDPEFTQRILRKYGRPSYYDAPTIWEAVQSLPEFDRLASAADEEQRWQPESVYWTDLLRSNETIRLGRPLQSVLGTNLWQNTRKYYMGDELLRQGLNEVFLDWLGYSGIWELYCNIYLKKLSNAVFELHEYIPEQHRSRIELQNRTHCTMIVYQYYYVYIGSILSTVQHTSKNEL
jgi:hypothetical protein